MGAVVDLEERRLLKEIATTLDAILTAACQIRDEIKVSNDLMREVSEEEFRFVMDDTVQ